MVGNGEDPKMYAVPFFPSGTAGALTLHPSRLSGFACPTSFLSHTKPQSREAEGGCRIKSGMTAERSALQLFRAGQPQLRDLGYVLRLLPEPGNPRWRQRMADDIGFGLRAR